jgi:hypothetical protein
MLFRTGSGRRSATSRRSNAILWWSGSVLLAIAVFNYYSWRTWKQASFVEVVTHTGMMSSIQPTTTSSTASYPLVKERIHYLIPSSPDKSLAAFVTNHVRLDTTYTTDEANAINISTRSLIYNPFHNCSATTQVRLAVLKRQPSASSSHKDDEWILQAMDSSGNHKTIGGDEFYVTYTDDKSANGATIVLDESTTTAVAIVTDRNDGAYSLRFVTVPFSTVAEEDLTGRGTLRVYFQFTCGISKLYQPFKEEWKSGAGTNISHSVTNVSMPPTQTFQPPKSEKSLSSFDNIYVFGDSLLFQMTHRSEILQADWFRPNVRSHANPDLTLTQASLLTVLDKLEAFHGQQLRGTEMTAQTTGREPAVALIVGSAAWDVLLQTEWQGMDFQPHLKACRWYIEAIRELYPKVTVFWRSPSAMVSLRY